MFLVSTAQQHNHAFVNNHHQSLPIQSSIASPPGSVSPEDSKYRLLNPVSSSMERSAPEYSQSGLPSPYPSSLGDNPSEASSSADPASAAQYATQQDVRPANYSTSATPTSEYGFHPSSARSSTFPEHIQRPPYHPASTHAGSSGGMAPQQSPSLPHGLPGHGGAGGNQPQQQPRSDPDVPIDPSIAAPSPTYPHSGQYSPYTPQEMTHGYQHTQSGIYPQPRPDWSNYQQNPITPGHPIYHPHAPTAAAAPRQPQGQVYSFVPIPGAQQHKRPRRRYEEIERMYKCGWNGCEKAYGTLNHLNAHVTMQSHGQKRTPEEFKEIRKEWKARKKEEEAQRKAEEERQRQAQAAQMQQAQQAAAAGAAQNGAPEAQATTDPTQPPTTYATARQVQLPPIGYQPANYPAPPSGQQPLPENYNPGNIYSPSSYGNPTSPYGQNPTQAMYGHPPNGAQPPS